jgi:hypothetical protein
LERSEVVETFEAAETAQSTVGAQKAASSSREYAPKCFPDHQYKTLRVLGQAIIPRDGESGGAVEAGAPEFIDLLSSEPREIFIVRRRMGRR